MAEEEEYARPGEAAGEGGIEASHGAVEVDVDLERAAAADADAEADAEAELEADLANEAEAERPDADGEPRPDPAVPEGGSLTGALEAILLVANEPLELSDLTALLGGCSWVPVRRGLRELQRGYEERGSGLELVEVAKGWRLVTRPLYAPVALRVQTVEREERLTRAQLEVLTIVAYRQPVLRADVDATRGADSSAALRAIMDKGLVRVAGRADKLGRPLLYATTRRFLERFGLKDLTKLPKPKPTDA